MPNPENEPGSVVAVPMLQDLPDPEESRVGARAYVLTVRGPVPQDLTQRVSEAHARALANERTPAVDAAAEGAGCHGGAANS